MTERELIRAHGIRVGEFDRLRRLELPEIPMQERRRRRRRSAPWAHPLRIMPTRSGALIR